MTKRLSDIYCVFLIHLVRIRSEVGPFLLAALVFPIGMYLFATGIANRNAAESASNMDKLNFLAASIVFSLSLTAISWLGYLLLENRFTGRLKLFATVPVEPSSYVFGILVFAIAQGALGTLSMLVAAWLLGVVFHSAFRARFALVGIVVLSIVSLCGISVIVAARARSFSEGSLFTDALGGGLVLLAPIYYPAASLPAALRWLSNALPTTYMFRAVNKTLLGETVGMEEVLALAISATVSLSIGFWLMKWREN